MRERNGNLITLAQEGFFDVITHGCNCFCTMGAGIAPQMAKAFGCDTFPMEASIHRGDINKLGTIDYEVQELILGSTTEISVTNLLSPNSGTQDLVVVNSYTQYHYGKNHLDGVDTPIDYEAITLCMRKLNKNFPGKTIGLPLIGCGLAGGDWRIVKKIFEKELTSMDAWVVHYTR